MVLPLLSSALASVALFGVLAAVGYPAHAVAARLGRWTHPSIGVSWLFGISMISAGAWIAFSTGVKLGVAYRILLTGAAVVIALRSLLAWRWPAFRVEGAAWRGAVSDAVTFCACATTYVALVDSKLTSADLNWPTIFNADIFVYIRSSGYLSLFPGGAPVVGQTALPAFVAHDVFGAFGLLTFTRFVLRTPLDHLAVPPMALAVGMIGLSVGRCGRAMFGLGLPVSALLAMVLVTGPLFQYVVLNYFLGQMLFIGLLLIFSLWLAEQGAAGARAGLAAALVLSAAAACVLLCYDVWTLQFVAVASTLVAAMRLSRPGRRRRDRVSAAALSGLSSGALALGCAAAVSPTRLAGVAGKLATLSVPNVAGWPLPFVDLDLLLGLPIPWRGLDPPKAGVVGSAMGAVLLLAAIGAATAKLDSGPHRVGRRMVFGLFCLATAAYLVVWAIFGESYQQWKFASTLPLGFGFAAAATVVHLLRLGASPVRAAVTSFGAGACFLACIASNVSIARDEIMATMAHLPASLGRSAAADEAPGDEPVYVDVDDVQRRMAALAMIHRKPVAFSGASQFGPGSGALPGRPSLTFRAACPEGDEGPTYGLVAAGPGGLTPLHVGDRLSLSQDVASCLSLEGFSPPDPWGRRSDGRRAAIRFDCACGAGTGDIEVVLNAGAPDLPDLPGPQVARIAADGAAPLAFALDPHGFQDLVVPVPSKADGRSTVDLEIDLPDAAPRPGAASGGAPLFALSLVSFEIRRRGGDGGGGRRGGP